MEQNFNNNRGNGFNGQNRNNVNNNNQAAMRPEVNNTCVQSGKSTISKVTQHINGNKTAYGVGIGAVTVIGLGFLAYKKGWIPGIKKTKKEPAPAATAEPKPGQEAAGESK